MILYSEEMQAVGNLGYLVAQLTLPEIRIVTEYVERLIASRPKSPAVAAKVIPIKSPSEQLQEELEPLPNSSLRYAV